VIRAVASGAAVFVMAALLAMNLKQAAILAGCVALASWVIGRSGR